MVIRQYKQEDYSAVVRLLVVCHVEPPAEESDLKGACIVAEENGEIVGCIWALVGLSTCAHVDWFAVHPDLRHTKLGWNLLRTMDLLLRDSGIHRYSFFIEPDNIDFINLVEKHKTANKIQKLRDLRFYRREIGDMK